MHLVLRNKAWRNAQQAGRNCMKQHCALHVLTIVSVFTLLSPPAHGAGSPHFTVFPESHAKAAVFCDGARFFDLGIAGWGPGWSWLGWRGELTEKDKRTVMISSAKTKNGAILTLRRVVQKKDSRTFAVSAELTSSKDTDLTLIALELSLSEAKFADGSIQAVVGNKKNKTITLPLGRKGIGDTVHSFLLSDGNGAGTQFTFDPPCTIHSDGAARIVLAEERIEAASPSKLNITVTLPGTMTFHPSPEDVPFPPASDTWFPFLPEKGGEGRPGEISMASWLEKPAGKHGRIIRREDKLLYNGKPVKLWGLNLCYGACAPDKERADKQAQFYAKYGINCVRLHKYADGPGWAGIQSEESFAEFDPDGLDRMDYLVAALKKRGIYVKLSAHFGAQKLGPADRRDVPYLEEFGSFTGRTKRVTTPHSAVHYSPELQTVQIKQIVNLLKHKNPYTGLRYADDPAVAFIEIINEQSILFYTSMSPLKESRTIRRATAERFCTYLREKYGSHEKLVENWGEKALNSFDNEVALPGDENLDKNNILPIGNPWYWDPKNLDGNESYRKTRLLDTLSFLYGLQNRFYDRYTEAVRGAGYSGEIVSSNWQAGRALSHYLNLHSDARIGTVDRHNYFGGGSSTQIDNAAMVSVPGSGMLSSGMQQVSGRPFMLSEWIHVSPTEWGVEGPAIIGAYGLGLQGWDVSYMFQNNDAGTFSREIGKSKWDVTAPQIMGVFPAVARQVLRGDIKEATVSAERYVHVPSLQNGRIGFDDKVSQKHDVKTFTCEEVPAETLAVARCTVVFSDREKATPVFPLERYHKNGIYHSTTGELAWKPGSNSRDGCFTINTPATKAVVGFAENTSHTLGQVTIAMQSRFAALYITAREKEKDLTTSRNILVVAVARARNSGMKVFNDARILERGGAPVVMEPVKARITINKPGGPTVHVLDHAGCRTGRSLPVKGTTFTIDGARDKTCYYLVEYR